MPHSWIGAEYILAVRSLFAYEREADQSLIVAAGVAAEWLDEGHEVMVRDLPTYFGRLSYNMRREGSDTLRVVLSGDLVIPPGRILIMPPLPRPLVAVEVNGRSSDLFQPDGFTCGECPADILLRC